MFKTNLKKQKSFVSFLCFLFGKSIIQLQILVYFELLKRIKGARNRGLWFCPHSVLAKTQLNKWAAAHVQQLRGKEDNVFVFCFCQV